MWVPRVARFNAALRERVFPALATQFGVRPERLRVIDAFVVKNAAARGQKFLPLHCDQSEISLTIPLNAADEYAGGGTYFSDLGRALNRDAGGLISFSGRAHHGAHPISRGTRYVIVAFLYEYREEGEAPRRKPL